jgi:hypothetical protein
MGHNLNANATLEDLSYCNFPGFQDTAGINRCAACYGRMDSEAYMANCTEIYLSLCSLRIHIANKLIFSPTNPPHSMPAAPTPLSSIPCCRKHNLQLHPHRYTYA